MAQEEHTQKCSISSGGGGSGGFSISRSSKRLKQKKIPQRGLGVAQLEKIRLEEQQKKDAAFQTQAAAAVNILSPNNAIMTPCDSSSDLAVQYHTFRPSVPPSPVSLPGTSPRAGLSSNSLFRPSPSMPNFDVLHSNQVKALGVDDADVGLSPGPGQGHCSWPIFLNGGYKLEEGDDQKIKHRGLPFRSNIHLTHEPTSPVLPLPNFSQNYQQPPPSSTVNASSGISPSSSVLKFQMEPPSNQSYCGNNCTPLWPEEEKMVGLKRQYPFSLDIPPAPPFHGKLHSSLVAPFARSDEPASSSNGSPVNLEPSLPVIRGPSSSILQSDPHSGRAIQEHGSMDGNFLTLSLPAAASSNSNAKYRHPFAKLDPSNRELPRTSQECCEDPNQRLGTADQPFFSFLPSPSLETGRGTNSASKCDHPMGESVDLSLKL